MRQISPVYFVLWEAMTRSAMNGRALVNLISGRIDGRRTAVSYDETKSAIKQSAQDINGVKKKTVS